MDPLPWVWNPSFGGGGGRHVWDQHQTPDHLCMLGKRSALSSFLACLGKLASGARVSGAFPLAVRTVKR